MRVKIIPVVEVLEEAAAMKVDNQDQPLPSKELKDLTAPLVVLEADLVEPTVDQETTVSVAEDLRIAQQEVDRAKVNEAAESIDILKDR